MGVLLLGITVNAAQAAPRDDEGNTERAASRDVWQSRRLSVAGQLGVGSPGGLVGLEVEYGLLRWLSLGAGAGPTLMVTGDVAPHAGAWLSPRLPLGTSALGVDAGVSAGPYRSRTLYDEHGSWARYGMARWFNAALRYQHVSEGGVSFRAFLGAATLANPSSGECGYGYEESACGHVTVGYGGIAVGYAFSSD